MWLGDSGRCRAQPDLIAGKEGGKLAPRRLGESLSFSPNGVNPVAEVVRDEFNVTVGHDVIGGPSDSLVRDGPNLLEHGCNFGRELPPSNDATREGGTHDVNDEMLAEAYRRGLRVRDWHSSVRYGLAFIFDES